MCLCSVVFVSYVCVRVNVCVYVCVLCVTMGLWLVSLTLAIIVWTEMQILARIGQ